MKPRSLLIAILAALLLLAEAARAQEVSPTDVAGRWMTHTGGISEFSRCGQSVCGTLEWEPSWEQTGIIPRDEKNPDENLRNRSFKGLTILYDFRETRRGWQRGTFYDPWFGKLYPANVRRLDENTLRLQGCVARIFCRSFDWTKLDPAETDAPASLTE